MSKYFESIDEMPVYNWHKMIDKPDFRLMVKDKRGKYDEAKAREKYAKIQEEFIDYFGISETYEKSLNLKKSIVSLNIEIALTGNKFLRNFVKEAEIELNQLSGNADKVDPIETKIHLEKYLGFRLNEKEISVKEYYTYLKVMSTSKSKKDERQN